MAASDQPKLEIRLWTDRLCYLSHQPRFSLVVFVTLRGSGQKPVTILRRDGGTLGVGLVNLLFSQLIECIDTESGRKIPVLADVDSEQQNASSLEKMAEPTSKSTTEAKLSLMTLFENRSDYLTFTTASDCRDYELIFTSKELKANRNYIIRCVPSLCLPWWSYDFKEAVHDYFASHGELPPLLETQQPLRCESTNTVSFDTRQELPQAPNVNVLLSAPSTSFSRSGNSPFEFSITFISHAPHPITVLAERHRARSVDSDIEIVLDEASRPRRRVAPDLIDDGNIDGPWQPEDFLQLVPGVPYRERRVLDPISKGHISLADLQVGTSYILRVLDERWDWWSFDPVEEVMRYAGERGSGSLGYAPAIQLTCSDEVKFFVEK